MAALAQAPTPGLPTPEVVIVEKINATVSTGLLKRFPSLIGLPDRLRDELLARDIIVHLAPSTREFDPPDDDDLSFAESGHVDVLADRIRVSYPGLASPLVLMALAERGSYFIGAAYLFSANGPRASNLQRIDRRVMRSAEIDDKFVKDLWPACLAETISRFASNKSAEGTRCPSSSQQLAAQWPPDKTRAVAPPQKGMLDDIPENRGGTVIIPPVDNGTAIVTVMPTAPSAPANPVPLPRAKPGASAAPPVKSAKAPPVGEPGLKGALGPGVAFPPEARLMEDILWYGFVWLPRDESRTRAMLQHMLDRQDEVGTCLRDYQTRVGAEGFEKLVFADLRRVPSFVSITRDMTRIGEDYFELRVEVPDDMGRAGTRCSSIKPRLPISEFYLDLGKFWLADARRRMAQFGSNQSKAAWRLPNALEAFAIASGLLRYSTEHNAAIDARFWMELDGQPGIISVRTKSTPAGSVFDLVDYELLNSKAPRTAGLVAIHN